MSSLLHKSMHTHQTEHSSSVCNARDKHHRRRFTGEEGQIEARHWDWRQRRSQALRLKTKEKPGTETEDKGEARLCQWRQLLCTLIHQTLSCSAHVCLRKLCNAEVEDPEHFVSLCPALSACRDDVLALASPQVRQSLPNPATHPLEFCDVILGTCWIDDLNTQKFCIEFLSALKEERAILLTPIPWKHQSWLDNSPKEEARKKKKIIMWNWDFPLVHFHIRVLLKLIPSSSTSI